jgi:hypothetical protein
MNEEDMKADINFLIDFILANHLQYGSRIVGRQHLIDIISKYKKVDGE